MRSTLGCYYYFNTAVAHRRSPPSFPLHACTPTKNAQASPGASAAQSTRRPDAENEPLDEEKVLEVSTVIFFVFVLTLTLSDPFET